MHCVCATFQLAFKLISAESGLQRLLLCVTHVWYSEAGSTHGSTGSVAFIGNEAAWAGGAMYAAGLDLFQVSNATFRWNKAEIGGAVFEAVSQGPASEFSNCMFDGNEASDGGAVYSYTGSNGDVFTSCVFRHNFASEFLRHSRGDRRNWSHTVAR